MADSNTSDDKIKTVPYRLPFALTSDMLARGIAEQRKRERVHDRRIRISEAQGFARRTLGCGCLECVRAWESFDDGGPLLLHGEALPVVFARRRRADGIDEVTP